MENMNIGFVFLFILIEEMVYLMYHFWKKHSDLKNKHIRWNNANGSELSTDDLKFIKQEAHAHQSFDLDDITWNDLDLDTLYQKMNQCFSAAGDQSLYRMLRNPLQNETSIIQRRTILQLFEKDEKLMNSLSSTLMNIDSDVRSPIDELYQSNMKITKGVYFGLCLWSLITLSVVILTFIDFKFFSIALLICMVNGVVSMQFLKRYAFVYMSVLQLYQYVQTYHQLAKLKVSDEVEDYFQIKKNAHTLKHIRKSFFTDFYSSDGFLLLFASRLFFLTPITCYRLTGKLIRYQEDVERSISTCGDLDALLSIAVYFKHNKVCEAVFSNQKQYVAKEMVHPLLMNPSANDVNLKQNILVSGSNASGKSTYLKMIAINAITAQCFGYAFGNSYEASLFHIYTSMSLQDYLEGGDSYFMVEIKSIKRILDAIQDDKNVLCMIDEILRGTNTGERIAASSEILHQFDKTQSICLSATHDIELQKIMKNYYQNIHFTEAFIEGNMHFDYKVHDGPSNSQNAIALLEKLAFDSHVIDEAKQQIDSYKQKGHWMILTNEVNEHA